MSAIIMLDARPANTKEIILIQHRIQDLTKLCGRIAENYQSYVIKEVKHARLVLNKYQIEYLSRAFNVHPQFIDQLIRICYIGHANLTYGYWQNDEALTGTEKQAKQLYHDFFEEPAYRHLDWNELKVGSVKIGRFFYLTNDPKITPGLILGNHDQILALILPSQIGQDLLQSLTQGDRLRFFNMERCRIAQPHDKRNIKTAGYIELCGLVLLLAGFLISGHTPDQLNNWLLGIGLAIFLIGSFASLIWLILQSPCYLRFKLKTDPISGRLARIDYTHDDPDNLGNQYRI